MITDVIKVLFAFLYVMLFMFSVGYVIGNLIFMFLH